MLAITFSNSFTWLFHIQNEKRIALKKKTHKDRTPKESSNWFIHNKIANRPIPRLTKTNSVK